MSITREDVIEALQDVSEAFGQIAARPNAKLAIERMLHELGPHVNAAGPDAQAAYIAAKQRLVNNMQPLVDPTNGQEYDI
jgi:hypothetical protein